MKNNNADEWVKKVDKKIIHWLWIIFVSMITALLTSIIVAKCLF